MADIIRHCPDCRRGRPFTQHHEPGCCPDSTDHCPEWLCVACGATLVIGDVPVAAAQTLAPAPQARVA